jgi:DNA-binding transcriptional regulator YiaG
MSQAAFASFLGVDASTVRSWEQELRPPSPLACRLLSEIEADPAHWRKRLAACLVTN